MGKRKYNYQKQQVAIKSDKQPETEIQYNEATTRQDMTKQNKTRRDETKRNKNEQ
eukprot:m.11440 g.11440  ORF g.11440 m.11440 type:complete len:55 (+) comp8809_c0_seq1:213-377(+)